LGRFIEEKGIVYLLKAVKKLQTLFPNKFIIDLYGDGPLKNDIENYILINNLTDNLRLMGFVQPQDVFQTLANYDCFLLPSVQEGFPYSLIEAFSSGLIVIASDVGGISEALIPNINGFLVIPKDIDDLIEKISKVIEKSSTELKEMKSNALITARNFSLVSMMSSLEKEYNDIISK
jgi:L-malate glycosyltransferase